LRQDRKGDERTAAKKGEGWQNKIVAHVSHRRKKEETTLRLGGGGGVFGVGGGPFK